MFLIPWVISMLLAGLFAVVAATISGLAVLAKMFAQSPKGVTKEWIPSALIEAKSTVPPSV